MEMTARIAGVVLILFSAAMLLAYAFQRTLIYYPERAALATLEPLAERKQLLTWHDENGNFLGWRSARGTGMPIIILHGNAGHALHRSEIVSRLNDIGVVAPIYILEYPGYGAVVSKELSCPPDLPPFIATVAVGEPCCPPPIIMVACGFVFVAATLR